MKKNCSAAPGGRARRLPAGAWRFSLVAGTLLLVGLAAASSPLFAQCAMCYQNAAAQGARGIRALNFGILILLLPPLAIAGCITRLAYRYRSSRETTPADFPAAKEREFTRV